MNQKKGTSFNQIKIPLIIKKYPNFRGSNVKKYIRIKEMQQEKLMVHKLRWKGSNMVNASYRKICVGIQADAEPCMIK